MTDLKNILIKGVLLILFFGLLSVPQVVWSEELSGDTTGIKVESKKMPDLVVTRINAPVSILAGERVLIEIKIANLGEENVPFAISSTTVNFNFGPAQVFYETPVPGAGEEISQKIQFIFPASKWYDITVTVDPQNDIEESNEDNNQLTKKVWVAQVNKGSRTPEAKEEKGCGCGK